MGYRKRLETSSGKNQCKCKNYRITKKTSQNANYFIIFLGAFIRLPLPTIPKPRFNAHSVSG